MQPGQYRGIKAPLFARGMQSRRPLFAMRAAVTALIVAAVVWPSICGAGEPTKEKPAPASGVEVVVMTAETWARLDKLIVLQSRLVQAQRDEIQALERQLATRKECF